MRGAVQAHSRQEQLRRQRAVQIVFCLKTKGTARSRSVARRTEGSIAGAQKACWSHSVLTVLALSLAPMQAAHVSMLALGSMSCK